MRTLGFAEAFLADFHTKLDGGLVTVAAARLNDVPNVDQLNRALQKMLSRHLLLRCEIVRDHQGRLCFSERTDWEAPTVIEKAIHPALWFEELLDTPLQADRPPFEFFLTREGEKPHVFLKVHHAIADGTALRSLLNEVLEGSCGNGSSEGEQALTPSVEEMMASTAKNFSAALPPPEGMEPWRFHRRVALPKRRSRVFLREIGCALLLTQAHNRGVKLNSILMEAVARVSSDLPNFPEKNALILPVSVRRRVKPRVPDETMGCYIGNALVYFGCGGDAEATSDAAVLERQLSVSLTSAITGPPDFAPEVLSQAVGSFLDPERDSFEYSLGLSNLGPDPQASSSVDGFWFAASVRPGHLGILITASTVGDRLCLTFHHAEPLVPPSAVERFADGVVAYLQKEV
ncbi:MAG: hypothetical protein AAGJ81_07245 [Verrucomicrobiota bacterium]